MEVVCVFMPRRFSSVATAREAVGLLQAGMGYVLYGGRGCGEGCYGGEGDHGVGERVHVDFDAP